MMGILSSRWLPGLEFVGEVEGCLNPWAAEQYHCISYLSSFLAFELLCYSILFNPVYLLQPFCYADVRILIEEQL